LTLKATYANGRTSVSSNNVGGPARLGAGPLDYSYSCTETTLTFKVVVYTSTFKREKEPGKETP
jgi:hypothetical protein